MAKKPDFNKGNSSLFETEEAVLSHWQSNSIFEKSLEKTKDGPVFSFYDGPPFITGIPHYGTLLPSVAKDIIPRYQTMKGKYVRRIWGWDVHGLPAENRVEKELGLKTKKDIEKFGVDKFIAECRKYVSTVSDQWSWYIDHIGRWADIDNAYRTDQLKYMESVIRVFKQLHDKDLIYRGRRVSLYCPHCATPLSKFEITMDDGNYREVEDSTATVAFRLKNDDVYILAWTTTPWTLPANLALAINPNTQYVKVTDGEKFYIMGHELLPNYQDGSLSIVEYIPGKKLVGESYEPLFKVDHQPNEQDYKVYGADFVSSKDGTGIVHIAPAFGEDDSKLGEDNGLSMLMTIDDEGNFLPLVGDWSGIHYIEANKLIIQALKDQGLLFRLDKTSHSYPHCYRCDSRLIYKSQVSWYLKIDGLRKQLLSKNKQINWVPKHFGEGRFRHNLETAPDWSLSRTRYWGTPLPVWETEDGEIFVPSSVEEISKLSGVEVTDLHRPAIDEVVLNLPSGKKAKRVKEVLDVWFESGAMPYAQDHYPFENEKEFERHFPADFIIEYTGQLRGWFYYLHVLGIALRDSIAFKNVIVHGVLWGNDGRKMSKSYGNYPDPKSTIEKYGGESLRLYLMSSSVMNGGDLNVEELGIREESRLLNVLHNSIRYLITYGGDSPETDKSAKLTVLDIWAKARLKEAANQYAKGLDGFDLQASTKAIRPLVEDLSTWYIRRSRDRFVAGDQAAISTLRDIFSSFALIFAPTLPFSCEYIYQLLNVGEEESVHLENYPELADVSSSEQQLIKDMEVVREICSAGNMLRSQAGISLRQPLASIYIEGKNILKDNAEYRQIVAEELNVKEVLFSDIPKELEGKQVGDFVIYLNTELNEELRREGRLRDLLRKLQDARKKSGLQVGQRVSLKYFTEDEELASIIEQYKTDISESASLNTINRSVQTKHEGDTKEDISFLLQ